jgi:hypothetical protein
MLLRWPLCTSKQGRERSAWQPALGPRASAAQIIGGSFISTGQLASKYARYQFRPHFFQVRRRRLQMPTLLRCGAAARAHPGILGERALAAPATAVCPGIASSPGVGLTPHWRSCVLTVPFIGCSPGVCPPPPLLLLQHASFRMVAPAIDESQYDMTNVSPERPLVPFFETSCMDSAPPHVGEGPCCSVSRRDRWVRAAGPALVPARSGSQDPV